MAHDSSNVNANDIKVLFEDGMNNAEFIDAVFKFQDPFLNQQLEKLYNEIHNIELRLREVISFIFADTYKQDFYNVLYELNIKPMYDDDKLNKDPVKRKEYLKKKLENEFFYLLFSHYIRFNDLANIDIGNIIAYLQKNIDFDGFRQKVLSRGINKEVYEDFITSLKSNLNNIEMVRNCVAHNRAPLKKEMDDYILSYQRIQKDIDTFWENRNIEIQTILPSNEYEDWETEVWNSVDIYLSRVEWKVNEGKISISDGNQEGASSLDFTSISQLVDFLRGKALEVANSYFVGEMEYLKTEFDPNRVIDTVLPKYCVQLLNMGWY